MAEPAPAVPSPATDKPAKRWPWHPVQAIALTVLVFVLSQLAAVMVLLSLGLLTGPRIGTLLEEGTVSQFLTIVLVESCVVLSIYVLLRRHNLSLASIGISRPRWQDAYLPLVMLVAYFASFIMLVTLLRWLVPALDVTQKQDIGFNDVEGPLLLSLTFLALVVFAPVAEEVLFRGFLYTGLRRRVGVVAATLLASLLFGAAHLMGGEQGASLLWIAGIDTMLLSFALCYLREITGRLWAPMLLHALKNSVAFTLLFVVGV